MWGLHRAPTAYPAGSPTGTHGCPGDGIGRRAGFRYLWPQGRGSSSLLLGTIHHGDAARDPKRLARMRNRSSMASPNIVSTVVFMANGTIHLHRHDLPEGLS